VCIVNFAKKNSITFVISAGAGYGFGLLILCAVLAREAQKHGVDVSFILQGDQFAKKALAEEVPCVEIKDWNEKNIKLCFGSVFVFDTKLDIDRECALISKSDSKLVLLDRLSPESDAVALYVLPIAHAPHSIIENERILVGSDYIVLPDTLLGLRAKKKETLLISLGGSDPFNVTETVMDACNLMMDDICDKKVKVVIGLSNRKADSIKRKADKYGMDVFCSPSQELFFSCIMESFLVIVGFGITVYEAAYLKVPSLFITHSKEDVECGIRLEQLIVGKLLGYGPSLSVERIKDGCLLAINQSGFLNGKPKISIDGRGAFRIIKKLVQLF